MQEKDNVEEVIVTVGIITIEDTAMVAGRKNILVQEKTETYTETIVVTKMVGTTVIEVVIDDKLLNVGCILMHLILYET